MDKYINVSFTQCILCRIWRSHSDGYEEFCLLGYNGVQSVESHPTFRRNIPPPSSGSKNKPSKKAVWSRYKALSCLAYSSTMKMEEAYFSETSDDFQRTTLHYIAENGTIQWILFPVFNEMWWVWPPLSDEIFCVFLSIHITWCNLMLEVLTESCEPHRFPIVMVAIMQKFSPWERITPRAYVLLCRMHPPNLVSVSLIRSFHSGNLNCKHTALFRSPGLHEQCCIVGNGLYVIVELPGTGVHAAQS
jgi:hypothetical protein